MWIMQMVRMFADIIPVCGKKVTCDNFPQCIPSVQQRAAWTRRGCRSSAAPARLLRLLAAATTCHPSSFPRTAHSATRAATRLLQLCGAHRGDSPLPVVYCKNVTILNIIARSMVGFLSNFMC